MTVKRMEENPTNNKISILVVEDSPTQAEKLKFILEKRGFAVSTASNGLEAVKFLKAKIPDIVISDILMPEMDGYELCHRIRFDLGLRDLPVILVTSLANPVDVIRGLEVGASNFITKPYDERFLASRIQYLLQNRELRKSVSSENGISVLLAGRKFSITAERLQILDLLLSTYENAYRQNRDLIETQHELQGLNERLEDLLQELTTEMAERRKMEDELKKSRDELELRVLERTTELSIANEELLAQIEERKRAEAGLSRQNRLYSVLSKVNEAIVRVRDPKELYERVCTIAVQDGLFKMAWVGLVDPDWRSVKPIASCGDPDGYLRDITIYADDRPESKGPTGTAVTTGKYSICSDIEHDHRMIPWREKLLKRGLRSSAALPIRTGRTIVGALTVYSEEPRFFTEEEIHLLTSLADDISYALESMSSDKKRLEAEEALRRINDELEQRVALRTSALEAANKELEAFSYSVSHDLRAPLRHMTGFTELLIKRQGAGLDAESRQYADSIVSASKKMGMLIDDLLAFSRIGRLEMSRRKVKLDILIHDVVGDFRNEVGGRDIEWKIAQLPDVECDAALMRQVFVNLISNAIKFTKRQPKAVIEVDCRTEGNEYIFVVKDNGAGFDSHYADKMFGVFQRLHTQDEFEGTGIGLANVRRIISRHGGRTWAEGAEEQGASIYFTLPKNNHS